jgi:uncharacterized protein
MPVPQDVPASQGGSAPEIGEVRDVSADGPPPAMRTVLADAEPPPYVSPPPPFEVSGPTSAARETAEQQAAEPAEAASPTASDGPAATRNLIAERATQLDVERLAADLAVGTHLLRDIVSSLTRPALDPRDNLPPPVFRRGIMKLEDLATGMELQGTVLNVVDFGVFVDIGLSDSGLVHISRLADRFIKDPHEVVGVGDVLKVWVVDVDKTRRRVSLTAIPPGHERQQRAERPQQQRPGRPQQPRQQQRQPQAQRPPRPQPAGVGPPAQGRGQPSGGGRPPAPHTNHGPRRDQRRGGRPQQAHGPKVVERAPTKPKVVKPITKAMEEGKEAMRSFGQLMQLFEKKKQKPEEEGETEQPEAGGGA